MREDILRLKAQGLTYNQIASELGCSKGTISYHLSPDGRAKSRIRSREHTDNKRRALQDIKEASGCVDCGEKYPYFMLHFDHLPEYEKIADITRLVRTAKWSDVEKEIAKCEVVCANCHAIRSHNRKSGSLA